MEEIPPMALSPSLTIDPRAYQQVMLAVEQYRLAESYPRLAQGLRSINLARPSPLDWRVFQAIKIEVEQILARLLKTPFPPAPAHVLGAGSLTLGQQVWDGARIGLSADELCRHVFIPGLTGGGKTSYQWHIALEAQRVFPNLRLWVVDPKGDGLWWAAKEARCLILHPHATFIAPLQQPTFLSEGEFLTLFTNTWASAWYGGQTTKALVMQTLRQTFERTALPSLRDLQRTMEQANTVKLPFNEREALHGGVGRIERFTAALPGTTESHQGLPYEDLFGNYSLYFFITTLGEGIEFLVLFLLSLLLQYKRRTQDRTLTHLLLIDEGLLAYSANNKIEGVPLLSMIQVLLREFGIAMIITSASVRIDPTLKANTYTHAGMPVTGEEINDFARLFNLDNAQREYVLRSHQRGTVILQFADRYRYPILATFPAPTYDKHVTDDMLRQAIARTDQLTKTTPATGITSQPPTEPTPPPHEPATEPPRNATAQRLLDYIVQEGITTVKAAYDALDLPAEIGNRAKKLLLTNALITATPIVAHSGRGGTATALEATTEGRDRATTKPPKGTRGGDSAQHRYLITTLAKHLPNSRIEHQLVTPTGTKSVDLALHYDPTIHEPLRLALNEHARTLHDEPPTIPPGALLAIEVETSDPLTTGPKNSIANHTGGASTITAILPQDLRRVRDALPKTIPTGLHDTVITVDALRLLTSLQESTAGKGRQRPLAL